LAAIAQRRPQATKLLRWWWGLEIDGGHLWCAAGGVKVTYITGKGLHSSDGAKIKPALMEMLQDHHISFVEGPGVVVATFSPA
jgi:hypothetical protein